MKPMPLPKVNLILKSYEFQIAEVLLQDCTIINRQYACAGFMAQY